MICRRFGSGPILTRKDIPDMPPEIIDATSVFNPGAVAIDGAIFLLLRVQTRGRRTYLVPARDSAGRTSTDGEKFTLARRPTELSGLGSLAAAGLEIFHVYDPRISLIGEDIFVVTALDTSQGGRLAIWRAGGNPSKGFGGLDSLMLTGLFGGLKGEKPDTRNGVLFPETIEGQYAMLHRPNLSVAGKENAAGNPLSGSTIVLSLSNDMENWDQDQPVFEGRPHFWDELIGSGPPPIKTERGWLHIYHGVATHFQSANIYQAGAVLLDLDNPAKVIARTPDNLLEPREPWELTGQVPNVVFPSGMIATKIDGQGFARHDSPVFIFYGAADTAVGRADATVAELLAKMTTI